MKNLLALLVFLILFAVEIFAQDNLNRQESENSAFLFILVNCFILLIGLFFGFFYNVLVVSNKKASVTWRLIAYSPGVAIFIIAFLGLNYEMDQVGYLGWLCFFAAAGHVAFVYHILNLPNKGEGDILNRHKLSEKLKEFTKDAKKEEISLWGGDLDFLGNSEEEINQSDQYTQLKGFSNINILCNRPDPKNETDKVRFGKILNDFQQKVVFKFYHDEKSPDIHVRGRIKKKNYTPYNRAALVHEKLKDGWYKTIEEDISAKACSEVYLRVWKMVWHHADPISDDEKSEYIEAYQKSIQK